MKLTAIILLTGSLTVSASGISQNITFSGKNVSFEKILTIIKEQTGYVTMTSADLLASIKPVTVNVINMPLPDFLELALQGQSLTFSLDDKNIILVKKSPNADLDTRLISPFVDAPPIKISGTVVGPNNQPLVGATIKVKGKNISTVSDNNGFFELSADAGSVLIVSYIGFERREFKVNSSGAVEIDLTPVDKSLDTAEVILNTGYHQIPKNRVTGSFEYLNNESLNRRVGSGIIDRLEGIASGVYFNKNFGASNSDLLQESPFSIRGRSTIFGDVRPLIVVDNFPYDGDIENINPNDVETISILKDAAAASIWGSSSGNGVIVITTKRAKLNQRARITFNSNISISERPDIVNDRDFIQSSDFIDLEQNLFDNGFYDGDIANTDNSYQPLTPVVEILKRKREGLIDAAEAERQIDFYRSKDVRKDMMQYLYRPAINQQYSIGIAGGTQKASYIFSVGYDKSVLSQVESKDDRLTLNFNNIYRPVTRLEVSTGINYVTGNRHSDNVFSQINTNGYGNTRTVYPYASFTDADGNPIAVVKGFSTDFINSSESRGFLNWEFKPLSEIGRNVTKYETKSVRLFSTLKYKVLDGLNVEVKYQYLNEVLNSRSIANKDSYFARDLINRYSNVENGMVVGYNIPIGGVISGSSNSEVKSHNARAQLSYDYYSAKNKINAIAGFDVREILNNRIVHGPLYGYNDEFELVQPVKVGVPFDLYPLGEGTIPFDQGLFQTIDRFRSWYGNVAYTYNSKYTFSASGRIDQSNLFGVRTNQKSIPLWSIGMKWQIDKESFYSFAMVPDLALRVTYGANGNLNKSVTAFTTASYSIFSDLLGNHYPVATVKYPGNDDLRWEKIKMFNVALDFGLLNGILSGSIEFYRKNGIDIIGDAMVPSSTGYTTIRGNFSNIKGSGFDVKLNGFILRNRFKWNTSILFSSNRDEVTKYTGQTPGVALVVGRPVQSVYSLQWGGLDLQGDPQGYENGVLSKNYGVLNSVTYDKQIFSGPRNPTTFGSFLNTFSYGNISLSFNVLYNFGHYFRRSSIDYFQLVNYWIGNVDYSKRWQKPGDELLTSVPSFPQMPDNSRDNFYKNSEALVFSADHIRFQDINISYNLNKIRFPSLPFQHIRIYSYINNIGMIWTANADKIDPFYPNGIRVPRSFAFGIQITF